LLRQNKNKWIFFGFLFLTFDAAAEAIINVENLRKEDTIGVFHAVSASFNSSQGNDDRNDYSFSYRLDNNSKSLDSFFIFNQSERKRDGVISQESTFIHGRLVFKNDRKADWEMLVQLSENPFKKYKRREVIGGGLRIAVDKNLRIGIQLLKEDEETLDNIVAKTDRLGFYIHDDFKVMENVNFNATLYFQPSVDNFEDDYKASALLAMNFNVNEALSFSIEYAYANDSSPPLNSDKIDESISTSFTYRF
tara:strand:- start:7856 stop:8605 length:750 start_codon:yes stop_codon:yes gene_type:complete